MNLALCTPLHVNSAIGRASLLLATELERREHLVTLINIEEEPPQQQTEAGSRESLWWKAPRANSALEAADIIIVQIGDNFAYHAGAISILARYRCVGIFHDANLYNLFRMWAFSQCSIPDGQARHDQQIAAIYGEQADAGKSHDFLKWLASQCTGALVHADFYKAAVREHCPGPVAKAHLAYDARPVDASPSPSDDFTLLTLGHINENKCCREVIEAIGALPGREAVEYRLAGPIAVAEQVRLRSIASSCGVRLTILGRVSDEEMSSELAKATVVCCLRRPVLEGASASAIEAMLSNRPIVVANDGFYAEISDDAAVKLPANFTVGDITQVMERLISDESLRSSLGRRGYMWASEECSISSYVSALESLVQEAVLATPHLELARTYADQLSALGLDLRDELSSDIADRLQALCFGSRP